MVSAIVEAVFQWLYNYVHGSLQMHYSLCMPAPMLPTQIVSCSLTSQFRNGICSLDWQVWVLYWNLKLASQKIRIEASNDSVMLVAWLFSQSNCTWSVARVVVWAVQRVSWIGTGQNPMQLHQRWVESEVPLLVPSQSSGMRTADRYSIGSWIGMASPPLPLRSVQEAVCLIARYSGSLKQSDKNLFWHATSIWKSTLRRMDPVFSPSPHPHIFMWLKKVCMQQGPMTFSQKKLLETGLLFLGHHRVPGSGHRSRYKHINHWEPHPAPQQYFLWWGLTRVTRHATESRQWAEAKGKWWGWGLPYVFAMERHPLRYSSHVHAVIQSEFYSKRFENGFGLMTFLLQVLWQASSAQPRLSLTLINVSQQNGVFSNCLEYISVQDRPEQLSAVLKFPLGPCWGLNPCKSPGCWCITQHRYSPESCCASTSLHLIVQDNKHAVAPGIETLVKCIKL